MSLVAELKLRNVFRVALFYIVSSWLLFYVTTSEAQDLVDYHIHYFSPAVVEAIEQSGFRFADSDYRFQPGADFYNLERVLENNGADRLVLLSGGFNFGELHEPELATAVKLENDRLADAVREHPDRVRGFCGLDPLAAHVLAEANRCLNTLGLHGIKLHFPISQFDIEKPEHRDRLATLLSIAAAHDAPLLIHNSTQGLSGAAYARSFINAFLDEGPAPLNIIFAHAGGPSTLDPFHFEFLSVMAEYLADDPTHAIHFELSGILRSGSTNREEDRHRLAGLMNEIGPEHFLFGSDYPMRSAAEYLESLRKNLPIESGDLAAIVQRDLFEPGSAVAP